MNEINREVSPLTRAIVWLRPSEVSPNDVHYKSIDYLLDGLLTASLKENKNDTALLVGRNFDRQIYVFATTKDPKKNELESFLTLLEKELISGDRILMVDDVEGRESFLRLIPQKLLPYFQTI
jgi:hypothetical protein